MAASTIGAWKSRASTIDAVAGGGRRYRNGELVRARLGSDFSCAAAERTTRRHARGATGDLVAAHCGCGAPEVVACSSEVPTGRLARAMLPCVAGLIARKPVHGALQWLVDRFRLALPATPGDTSCAYGQLGWADGQ